MEKTHLTRFYLSANTPLGFVSRLNLLCDCKRFSRILLLKGGTRKSRSALISCAAKAAKEAGKDVHFIASADALDVPEAAYWDGKAIIDSAPPLSIEPRYPGAVEDVIWLGGCFDAEKLNLQREKIINLTGQEERLREQARRYLCAADALINDNYRIALEATDTEKIARQANRIAENDLHSSETPLEESCIFSDGFCLLPELSDAGLFKTVVLLEDDLGPSASLLLKALHKHAKEKKCHVVCGYSPMAPFERLEQLIFPDISLAFLTVNERLKVTCEPQRIINARRFTDKNILATYKNRLTFNRKAARQMLSQSQALLQNAQQAHKALEECYDTAFEQSSFDLLCQKLSAFV